MDLSAIPRELLALLFLLVVIVPWRGVARIRALLLRADAPPGSRIRIYLPTIVLQWCTSGFMAWRCAVHGFHLGSLGVSCPHPLYAVSLGFVIASIFGAVQMAGFHALSRIPADQRGRTFELSQKLMPRNAPEGAIFLALVSTVAICEEFLYRGFVFTMLQFLFGGSAVAAVVFSSVLFGLGHLYQGPRGVLATSILGCAFSIGRVFTSSLLPGAIGHFTVDFLAGFAAPGGFLASRRLLRSETAEISDEPPS